MFFAAESLATKRRLSSMRSKHSVSFVRKHTRPVPGSAIKTKHWPMLSSDL